MIYANWPTSSGSSPARSRLEEIPSFLEYVAEVIVHRISTDEELTGNLPARRSLSRQSRDLKLSECQVMRRFCSSGAGALTCCQ
jgi:hypothetical protein